MPRFIRANQLEVSSRLPFAGFTVNTGVAGPAWFEVAVATDPALFRAENKVQRSQNNFYCSGAEGALPAPRGEAVYILPAQVLDRFVGQDRLFYAFATFASPDRQGAEVAALPEQATPYLYVSRTFTGRPRGLAWKLGGRAAGAGFSGNGAALSWAGDAAQPRVAEPAPAPANGGATAPAPGNGSAAAPVASPYADGFETRYGPVAPPPRPRPAARAAAVARPLDVATPDYCPTSGDQALQCLLDFTQRLVTWTVGVPDTRFFPHSAICKIELSGGGHGTGAYIARDRILTAAHVVDGQTSLTIIPGKNGSSQSAAHEPFGRFTVSSSDWRIYPRYTESGGSNDYDLAVIRVNTPPPNGQYFETLEELRQTPASAITVCGYAADTVDPNVQHLDGDTVREASTDTFRYNLHTQGGTSGSPVFYTAGIDDPVQQVCRVETRLVGVHVSSAGGPGLNQCCALTQEKIFWIWSAFDSATYGLSRANAAPRAAAVAAPRRVRGRPAQAAALAVARPLDIATPDYCPTSGFEALQCLFDFTQRLVTWTVGVPDTGFFPHSAICKIELPDGRPDGTGFYIARDRILTAAHVVDGQTSLTIIPGKNGPTQSRAHEPFGRFTVSASDWRIYPRYTESGGSNDYDLAVIRVNTPPPNGQYFETLEELRQTPASAIVVCGYAADTVDPNVQHLDGDTVREASPDTFRYNLHTQGGTSGSPVFYTVGIDDPVQQVCRVETRLVGVHVSARGGPGLNQCCALTEEKIFWIWSAFNGTTYGLSRPAAPRAAAVAVPRPVRARTARAAALAARPRLFNVNVQYNVHLIPQPNKTSCWAASMAMLLGYYRGQSITPQSLAEEVGRDLNTCYGWDMLEEVKNHFGFLEIALPDNACLYYPPDQWYRWLQDYGPLWITTVGAPSHAVVLSGLSGDLTADGTRAHIVNPWDINTAFDNDPTEFRPPNRGAEYDLNFPDLASEFGRLDLENYGRWRVLYLPPGAATTSLSIRTAALPMAAVLEVEPAPSTIPGVTITRETGMRGTITWSFDRLQGKKHVDNDPANEGTQPYQAVTTPVEGPREPTTGAFADCEIRWQANGRSLGEIEVAIANAQEDMRCVQEIRAAIVDDPGAYMLPPSPDRFAALSVHFEYRFTGTGTPAGVARTEIRLLGNGSLERRHYWSATPQV